MNKHTLYVLSLFDGFSGGQQALNRMGITDYQYYASEIDEAAIKVTQYRYHNTVQVGDVTKLKGSDFIHVNLILAGFPCQSISIAGKMKGITTVDGTIIDTLEKYLELKAQGVAMNPSALFWEFVRLYEEIKFFNPDVKFLLENVANKQWEELISHALGFQAYTINSSGLSAQNRKRNYWTNMVQSTWYLYDKNTYLSDVIPGAVAGAGIRGVARENWTYDPVHPKRKKHKGKLTIRKDHKSNCITTKPGNTGKYLTTDGEILNLTPEHCELLQTVTPGFTDVPGVTKAQRYHMIGNGWTIDVIINFLQKLEY
jgi:site-specific DNA-cytosine methylase